MTRNSAGLFLKLLLQGYSKGKRQHKPTIATRCGTWKPRQSLVRIRAFSSRGNSSPKAKPAPLNGNLKRKPRLSLVRIRAFSKTSVSVFGISGGLFERQVRKMACHFTPPSEFRTPQKRQLRFALRKRPYAEVFGTLNKMFSFNKASKLPLYSLTHIFLSA